MVAFTNESDASVSQYNGDYLYTENAENFEIFLAAIGDQTIQYETCKYGTQRVLAFANWSNTCPLRFDEKIRQETEKYSEIDVENIHVKDSFQGGTFAFYHCYPYYPEYSMYENESNEEENNYLEFLTRLNKHHEQPVVISEFGVPSSRGKASYEQNRDLGRDQGGLSETQQGQALVSMWKDIKASGSAGGMVFSWQDEWYKWTWNSMAAVDLNNVCYWSDYQTNVQSFGLLAFDPGRKKSICYVDGDQKEWDEKDVVIKQNDFSISMKYDVKFIYFLLEKDGLNIDEDTIYIPIDTTWKSGSTDAKNFNLTMTEPADFVIQIKGRKNSRLWVQERYNTVTALFGNQMKRYFNQYYSEPASDSGTFQQVQMLLQEVDYYAQGKKISFQDYNPNYPDIFYTLSQTYETGKLTYGNANPSAADYNSLADFCAGDGFVEIKIPWQLLNFADPSTMRIHDDYYECHGVEYLSIDSINVGVGDGSTIIEMSSFPLKKLGDNPEYHERLKESYYILQEEWAKNEKRMVK